MVYGIFFYRTKPCLLGQLLAFKKSVGGKLDRRIRITAVDNFQGEENDIILLSLVRSNVEVMCRTCGGHACFELFSQFRSCHFMLVRFTNRSF